MGINVNDDKLISPYLEAWRWIQANPGTGRSLCLAKLLLSLWNDSNAFSFRECVDELDEDLSDLALRVAIHFVNFGENVELLAIGDQLCVAYPELWELGQAAWTAKRQLRAQSQAQAQGRQSEDTEGTDYPVSITINGHDLTPAQVSTVRSALSSLNSILRALNEIPVPPATPRNVAFVDKHMPRLAELRAYMFAPPAEFPTQAAVSAPYIVINGQPLTADQSHAVKVAVSSIAKSAALDRVGGNADANQAVAAFRARCNEVEALASRPATPATSSIVSVEPKKDARMRISVEIPSDRHDVFMRMWREVISGRFPQDQAIRARAVDRNQGIASLRELVMVAQRHSGQCRYIANFLAGLYNGPRFPFDLTDLRAIDDELWEHVMAVLRLDQSPEKEVHQYFVDGGILWEHDIIGRWNLDKKTAVHSAYLLAAYLEGKLEGAPQDEQSRRLRQLQHHIEDWRRAVDAPPDIGTDV